MKLKVRDESGRVEYFDTVRRRLLDIPWSQRQELLADLVSRLDELPPRTHPISVLGDGEKYARLMREAAGYGPTAPRRFAYIRAWRLRRKILVAMSSVLGLALVVGGGLGVRWYAHYQPLDASLVTAGSTARSYVPAIPTDTTYWHYSPGARVVIGAELENHGRFTVTVTGFDVSTTPYGPIVPTQLRYTRDRANVSEWQRATPVQTLSVQPGEQLFVFVVMKMVPWKMAADSSVTQSPPTLRVEVIGVHHRLPIAGQQIGIVGPGVAAAG